MLHTKLALSLLPVSVGHGVGSNNPRHSTPNTITITYICKEQNAFCVEINENEEEALGRTKRVHTNTCMSLHIHMHVPHTAYKCIRGAPVLDPGRRSGNEEDQEEEGTRRPGRRAEPQRQGEPAGPGKQIDPKYFLLATYINLQSYLGNYRLSKLCSTLAFKWIDNRGPRGPVFLHPLRQTKLAKLLERSQVYHLFHIQILCQACSKELQTVS